MQAGKAQDSDEVESNNRATELELGTQYLFFMGGPIFMDEDDSCAVTTNFTQPTTVSPVFDAGESAAAPPHTNLNLSWEAAEPQTWVDETEALDDNECEQQKLEDIESYLLNSDEEEDEEQNQVSGFAQPEPLDFIEPIVDVVSDDEAPEALLELGNEEPTPEAVALQQLESAAAKLDNRTRFSIRDALFRLAENAARRHAVHPEKTDCKMSTHSFETSTNSLDRSIASLLFHKLPTTVHQLEQRQLASSSCVSPGAANSHCPQPKPRAPAPPRARLPLLHKHPCAGMLSSNNNNNINIPQRQAAVETKPTTHYIITQKPLPGVTKRMAVDLGGRKQSVAVSTTIPRKRIKLNPANSLAV